MATIHPGGIHSDYSSNIEIKAKDSSRYKLTAWNNMTIDGNIDPDLVAGFNLSCYGGNIMQLSVETYNDPEVNPNVGFKGQTLTYHIEEITIKTSSKMTATQLYMMETPKASRDMHKRLFKLPIPNKCSCCGAEAEIYIEDHKEWKVGCECGEDFFLEKVNEQGLSLQERGLDGEYIEMVDKWNEMQKD